MLHSLTSEAETKHMEAKIQKMTEWGYDVSVFPTIMGWVCWALRSDGNNIQALGQDFRLVRVAGMNSPEGALNRVFAHLKTIQGYA